MSVRRHQKDMAQEIIRAMIRTGFLAPGDLVPTAAELAEAIPYVSRASWAQGKCWLLHECVLTRPGLGGRMRVAEAGEGSGTASALACEPGPAVPLPAPP